MPTKPQRKIIRPSQQEEDERIGIKALPPMQGIGEPVETDDFGLPKTPTIQKISPTNNRYLFVGPPGFGKTEFFAQFEDAVLLACEAGHKYVNCFKIIIPSWDKTPKKTHDEDGNVMMSFMDAVDKIVASNRFRFVIIDTVDALIKMITDHFTTTSGVQHVSDLGDYGKGYDMGQNQPFRIQTARLFQSGRGMGYITHQEIKDHVAKGKKIQKKETSLPNGIIKILYPQVEVVLHGEFGTVREGFKHRDRVIRTEGSEEILAKNRGGVLPPAWISHHDPKKRWEQFKRFYSNPESVEEAYKEFLEVYEG